MMLKTAILCVITLISLLPTVNNHPLCADGCICQNTNIDCKENQLTQLPPGLNLNVTHLDLSINELAVFPDDLHQCINLVYLNLSHNKIEILGMEAFRDLTNLKVLDLSYNKFTDWKDIHSTAFASTASLTFLDISHNSLRNLPSGKLNIKSLTTLYMNNCSVSSVSSIISENFPNLEELYVARNPITYLQVWSNFNNNLKIFDLSNCDLHYIHELAFNNFQSLQTLYMHQNINLKEFISNISTLSYLDLSDCGLATFPSGRLPNLLRAKLHGNNFKIITNNSFQYMRKLNSLDISNNAISKIETGAFSLLKDIEKIDLSRNTLASIDINVFSNNTQLETLQLSRNYFDTVPKLNSDSLEILDLSSCEIASISQGALIDMPKLRILNLSKNIFSLLPDYLTADQLEDLDASLCRIKNINNKTFVIMSSLRKLNLAGNRLTTSSPESFSQVISLDISDNPWRCDCAQLKPLFDWLTKTGKDTESLYCQSPDIHEGSPWVTACQEEWNIKTNSGDTVWWYTTGLIITIMVFLVFVLIMRRIYLLKQKRARQIVEARRADERAALNRMRRMQLEARESSNRNAPDPRELQRPPSYNEAVSLPRLDASHPSLLGSLHSIASKQSINGSSTDVSKRSRPRRKRRRRRSDPSEGQRASRVTVDSDTSEPDPPQPRATLESDF